MKKGRENAADENCISQPLQRTLPKRYGPGNSWVPRKSIAFGFVGMGQYVKDMGSADSGRVIDPGIRLPVGLESRDQILGLEQKIFPCAETKAPGRTGLDAGRFEPD